MPGGTDRVLSGDDVGFSRYFLQRAAGGLGQDEGEQRAEDRYPGCEEPGKIPGRPPAVCSLRESFRGSAALVMRFPTRQPGGVLPQLPHRGSFEHPYVRIRQRCPGIAACGTAAQGAQGENRASVLQRREDVQAAVSAHTGEDAPHLIVALRSIFRALRQERLIFANPCAGISVTRSEALPVTLPPDRLAGLLDRARTPPAGSLSR